MIGMNCHGCQVCLCLLTLFNFIKYNFRENECVSLKLSNLQFGILKPLVCLSIYFSNLPVWTPFCDFFLKIENICCSSI